MFIPVPIAVPPWGSSSILAEAAFKDFLELVNWAFQPESSCEKSIGIASIKCVLPVLTLPLTSFIFASIASIKISKLGSNSLSISSKELMHIAVGITSFELWLIFTSSFAPIAVLDLVEATFAITSLAFIFVLVPEPV